MKECSTCKTLKNLDEFNRDKRAKDNKRAECKLCHRVNSRKHRENNLDRASENWYKWKKENPKKYILWRAKQQARLKGRDFDLKEEDIHLPKECPILGIELKYLDATLNDPQAASLDRLDSSKGYVKGNVNIVSFRANTLKGGATIEELRAVIEWMEKQNELF